MRGTEWHFAEADDEFTGDACSHLPNYAEKAE
jgi:hypothetical protein